MSDNNVKMIRDCIAAIYRQHSILQGIQARVLERGYLRESNIAFLMNQGVHFLHLAEEVLALTCDNINSCPADYNGEAERVIKSWEFEDEHDLSGYQE